MMRSMKGGRTTFLGEVDTVPGRDPFDFNTLWTAASEQGTGDTKRVRQTDHGRGWRTMIMEIIKAA